MTERMRNRADAEWEAVEVRAGALVPSQRRRQVVDARVLPARVAAQLPRGERRWRWVLVYAGALPFFGAGGWLSGRAGAVFLAQVATAVGSFAVAVLLLYVAVSVAGRHHCPGCPDH